MSAYTAPEQSIPTATLRAYNERDDIRQYLINRAADHFDGPIHINADVQPDMTLPFTERLDEDGDIV